ncbi:MAG: phage major capsid protein, partial [Candidatus Aminicenantes bacterium]|nr:phage major capsid protein [Candidatus Aminicenantes bacterium]
MLEEKEQKVLDEIIGAIKAVREKSELLETARAAQETKQAEQKALIEKACKKIDEIEVGYKRAICLASGKSDKTPEFKAFLDWMRKGVPIPADVETKLMRLSDATLGGYLTTPEVSSELLKGVIEYSPIREIARVRTTSKESVKIRKRTGVFSAAWTGEKGTKTETVGLTYGMEEVPNHELYALVDVTNADLEDSDFNLETELNAEFSEQFGVAEGAGFVSGNGVGKPEGFLANTIVAHVASGDANLIKADSLFTLYFAPKSAYTKNLKFVMNRATMLAISILKSAVDGQYL